MEPCGLAPEASVCFCPQHVTRTSARAWECQERQGWGAPSPRSTAEHCTCGSASRKMQDWEIVRNLQILKG